MGVKLFNKGGPLSFGDTGHAQFAAHGEAFETDAKTAQALMASDPNIVPWSESEPEVADSAPAVVLAAPALAPAPAVSSFEYQSDLDFTGLKVGELRSKLKSVGLPTDGKQPELAAKMAAFQAGYEQGFTAGQMAPPKPDSSEEAQSASATPEDQTDAKGQPDPGSVTLGDLGEGGKTK